MMLLDTDVLIGVALDELPHSDASSEILEWIEKGGEDACIAWHTVSNLYHIVAIRERRGRDSALNFILHLTRFVSVVPTDTESVRYAARLPMSDFEDAMQVAAARACGARLIITRNISDYRQSPIPAITPAQALDGIAG